MPKDMKLIKDMITDPPLFEYTTPEGSLTRQAEYRVLRVSTATRSL